MLELQAVAYAYPQGAAASAPADSAGASAALRGVSLTVRPGERLAVLGPNGSGKSTLLRVMAGQLRPDAGGVLLDGVPMDGARGLGLLRRSVGVVGQDPDDQMVASTVFEEAAFGPCNLGLPLDEVRSRTLRALEACGLAGFERREVATLSGGQRQRLAIAGALAMRPAYLLCDEPCSMLDPQARRDVLAVLGEMSARGCAVVHATHELEEALACDRAVVVEKGRVVWEGAPAGLLLDDAALDRAVCLLTPWLEAARSLVGAGLLPADAPFGDPAACAALVARAGKRAVRRARAVVGVQGAGGAWAAAGAPGTLEASPGTSREPRLSAAPPDSAAGLRVRGAWFSYSRPMRGHEPAWAVRDADLEVAPGATVLVAGRTGSGKSTLARLAAGLLRPARGEAWVDGAPARAGGVGYAFQRAEDQLFAATVLDDVAFGPANLGCTRDEARRRAVRALERVGLDPGVFGEASPFALSGGQMRRAALAGVLAMEAPYVVFDEPTAGLDAGGMARLAAVLDGLTADGAGVAVVSHDVARLAALSDRAVVLDGGRVAWSGPACALPADALADAGLVPDGLACFARALDGVAAGEGAGDGGRR